MGDLPLYQFPTRASAGVLFGLSLPRLLALGAAGVVFVVMMSVQTAGSLAVGSLLIAVLTGVTFVRIGGRPVIEWLPVWTLHGWSMATRNNEFYSSPDLTDEDLPEDILDLPGELFGLELHDLPVASEAIVANATPTGYGVIRDTFRQRLVAIAEISGDDFLFLDPADQHARVAGWGAFLDHIAGALPEISRLQIVHVAEPSATESLARWHGDHGGHGNVDTAASYREVLTSTGMSGQEHRLLLAIGLDLRRARRPIRQAGGGLKGAAAVLMDRAATIEETLATSGLAVHGWLPARAIANLLRVAFDPASRELLDAFDEDVNAGGGVDPTAAGPTAMAEGWSAVRHDSGWSATLQIVRPPSRPVTGDFLQHLLIGVPAVRRLSILYVPTPAAVAERRAQSQQVSTEAEQEVRSRWGFGISARHRHQHADAARREEELVDGRAVFRVVWLITITELTLPQLEGAVGQVEAAGRRCGLELRRMSGLQRQASAFTLPLCRGAR